MGSRGKATRSTSALTERQSYWLKHIRTAEGRGEALKHYAQRKRLSAHSLYEAKRRLRELGVLAAAADRAKPAPRFARVEVVAASKPPVARPSPFRVRLAGGVELEWAEAPQGEALRDLVGMLAG